MSETPDWPALAKIQSAAIDELRAKLEAAERERDAHECGDTADYWEGYAKEAQATANASIAENADLRAMLNRLEWFNSEEHPGVYCWVCLSDKHAGHAPDCELKRLLEPK